jgi:hypothetical protein
MDGSTRVSSDTVGLPVFRALCTQNGGKAIPALLTGASEPSPVEVTPMDARRTGLLASSVYSRRRLLGLRDPTACGGPRSARLIHTV